MLTDRVPFEGDTPITIGVKQKTEKPEDPKDYNQPIPDDLNKLILKCLEKDRENRYQSAEELVSDLERLEQGLPTKNRAIDEKRTRTSKEVTVAISLKKKYYFAFAIVVIVVIILAIILGRNPNLMQIVSLLCLS